jgi:hypothetical protein
MLALLPACSNVSDFEQGLTGARATAWRLCKSEFLSEYRLDITSAPDRVESASSYILFEWDRSEAEQNGGPLMCKTNAAGSALVEIRMTTGF